MTAFLIIGVLALSAAVVLTFIPLMPSMVLALIGVWAMDHSGYIHVSPNQMMFWMIVTAILLITERFGVDRGGVDRRLRGYISIAAMASAVVAVSVGADMVTVALGPVAGVLLGTLFYCRTHGKGLTFSLLMKLSPTLWPMVVTYSLVGITLIGLISK